MKLKNLFILLIILVLLMSGNAWAATTNFTCASGSCEWNTAGNWSTGVPIAGDTATFTGVATGITVTATTTAINAATIDFSGAAGAFTFSGSVPITASTITVKTGMTWTETGKITLTGVSGTIFTATGATISSAPEIQIGNGTLTYTGDVTFAGAGLTYGNLTIKKHAGSKSVIVIGNNTWDNAVVDTPNDVYPYQNFLLHYGSTQTVNSLSAVGTVTHPITISSDNATITASLVDTFGTNVIRYARIQDISAYGGAVWDVTDGTSVKLSNVSGWTFPVTNYYVNSIGNDTYCSGKSSISQPATGRADSVTKASNGAYSIYSDCNCGGTGGTGNGMVVRITTGSSGYINADSSLIVINGGTGYSIGDTITLPGGANCVNNKTGGTCGATGNGTVTVSTIDCAKQTLAGINANSYSAADVVNIRNGETFTGPIKSTPVSIGVTYQGYNDPSAPSTAMPIIAGGSDGGRTISAYVRAKYQTFKGLRFTSPIRADGGFDFTAIYNWFDSPVITGSNGIIDIGGGTAGIYNNDFTDIQGTVIFITGAAAVGNIKNNIFYGASGTPITPYLSGTANVSNNIFYGTQGYNQGQYPSHCVATGTGVCNEMDNIYNYNPKFITAKYPQTIKVAWGHDDSGNLPHFFNTLEAYPQLTKASFNYYVSFNIAQDTDKLCAATAHCTNKSLTACTTGGPNYVGCCNACLKNDVDLGRVEVVDHSYHHQGMSDDIYTTITTTNTNPSLTIDGTSATKQIILSSDAGTITVDYTANDGTASAKTVANLEVAMGCIGIGCPTSTSGWTFTTPSTSQEGLFLSSLKDVITPVTTFPHSLLVDKGTATNRLYRDEIGIAKTALETLFGVGKITAFSCPASNGVGNIDKTAWDWFENNGTFKGVRNDSGLGDKTLNAVNYWNTLSLPAYAFRGDNGALQGSEVYVRGAARNAVAWAQSRGGFLQNYTHSTTDLSIAQIGWIFDEFQNMGVEFVTASELYDWIRSQTTNVIDSALCNTDYNTTAHPSAGQCHGGTFGAYDLHLTATSSAINAGIDVCASLVDATDIAGNAVCTGGTFVGKGSAPDIGAYEYQGGSTSSGMWIKVGGKWRYF